MGRSRVPSSSMWGFAGVSLQNGFVGCGGHVFRCRPDRGQHRRTTALRPGDVHVVKARWNFADQGPESRIDRWRITFVGYCEASPAGYEVARLFERPDSHLVPVGPDASAFEKLPNLVVSCRYLLARCDEHVFSIEIADVHLFSYREPV